MLWPDSVSWPVARVLEDVGDVVRRGSGKRARAATASHSTTPSTSTASIGRRIVRRGMGGFTLTVPFQGLAHRLGLAEEAADVSGDRVRGGAYSCRPTRSRRSCPGSRTRPQLPCAAPCGRSTAGRLVAFSWKWIRTGNTKITRPHCDSDGHGASPRRIRHHRHLDDHGLAGLVLAADRRHGQLGVTGPSTGT